MQKAGKRQNRAKPGEMRDVPLLLPLQASEASAWALPGHSQPLGEHWALVLAPAFSVLLIVTKVVLIQHSSL